jgi:hypothetical protein
MIPLKTVGHPTHRIDAELRVTGAATYTADLKLPGMLYARVLRSPHPHARIKRVDTSRAEALPGVKAILTRDNCDVTWASGDSRNKRYLFNNPARFAGDAVAAIDRHTAEEAIGLIQVDYEVLPFVLDAEEALKDNSPFSRAAIYRLPCAANMCLMCRSAGTWKRASKPPTTSTKITTRRRISTTRNSSFALPWPLGKATSLRFTPPRKALQIAGRTSPKT